MAIKNASSKLPKEEVDKLRKMIHDVRSPLITIRGFAEILRHKLGDRVTDEEDAYFEKILANVDRMADCLDDLHIKVRSYSPK